MQPGLFQRLIGRLLNLLSLWMEYHVQYHDSAIVLIRAAFRLLAYPVTAGGWGEDSVFPIRRT